MKVRNAGKVIQANSSKEGVHFNHAEWADVGGFCNRLITSVHGRSLRQNRSAIEAILTHCNSRLVTHCNS